MTVIADNEKRVVLPDAQPGECFDVQVCDNGFVLRKLKSLSPGPAKVNFIKRDGFTVAMADQPIDEQALREALANFP
ncbi:MAG: hypothetical protein L0338_18680 [Acidobacteria bacterium]|nr:hypothetical protein [Acidobacteriota bacterium]